MLVQLSSQTAPQPDAASVHPTTTVGANAADPAKQTTAQSGAAPGVVTHISSAARSAVEKESSDTPQTPSLPNDSLDMMTNLKAHAIKMGGDALATLRSGLQSSVEMALDITYLTELTLGHTMGVTEYFTKAEYVEKYDIGAALGCIRDYLRDNPAAEESCTVESQGMSGVAQEAPHKFERWVERLRGPKVEILETMAVGAVAGYVLARGTRYLRG